jgi:hypothetical protein
LGLATAAALGATPGVANAVCAAGSPSLSPNAFTGTVVRLGVDHRQAFVQKDDGTQVEVDGGTLGPDVHSSDEVVFVLGGHYEIDPGNSRSPFEANDCTTTLLGVVALASPTPTASPSPSTSGSPSSGSPSSGSTPTSATPTSALPSPIRSLVASAQMTVYQTSSTYPDFVTVAIFAVVSAILLSFAYLVRVIRRRRHRSD